ncbi:hypothetical protein KC852_03465, partial [Candidatus Nomurabacteria bacterium]|nr:hypothetical protein [Candidatus Nomurabacteria bacterium]
NKAKDVSIKMAGEVAGQVAGAVRGLLVTAGLAAVGGAALVGRGGAALSSGASRSAANYAAANPADATFTNASRWQKFGNRINQFNKKRADKVDAEEELNKRAEKKTKVAGTKFSDLSSSARNQVMDEFNRDELAKARFGGKTWDKLKDHEQKTLEAFKGTTLSWADAIEAENITRGARGLNSLDTGQDLAQATRYGKGGLRDRGNYQLDKILAATKTGSYDIRDLANVKEWYLKMPAIAIRELFKNASVETGKAQKNFWQDIGEAIKKGAESADIKLNIDTSSSKIKKDE